MIRAIKVRLYPTKEQEKVMWKSSGTARYAYNWGLDYETKYYKENSKFLSIVDLRKEFTKLRNTKEYEWIKEVSSEIGQQSLKDLGDSFNRFFNKKSKYPKYKKKSKSEVSFYHLGNKFTVKDNRINLEKIGYVKMKDERRLPQGNYRKEKITLINPRIKHNGKYWYLIVGMEFKEEKEQELNPISIGIDLGIKNLAVVSNIDKHFKNVNKSKKMKKINKCLKKYQKRVSKKYEMNKKGNKFKKTENIKKLEKKMKLINKKITDIRLNHIHQVTNEIVKTKPSKIVMEDLNVKGMMKNRHLSKAIQEQSFNKFINIMKYKAEEKKIEFIKADRFYPSSKKCSRCGAIKKDLKLSDRTYKCECGLKIDRDKNASINLANYKSI